MNSTKENSNKTDTDLLKILLVDDNAMNLQILHGTLGGLGYRLLAARSGNQALQIARKAQPALILLDVMMPGIDGYETCRQLKADEKTRDSIVIFLTALQETKDKVQGLSLGAVDFITKPFDAEEVIARVTSQIEVYRLQHNLRSENDALNDKLNALTVNDDPHNPQQQEGWLRSIITQGESDKVEFKSTLRWNLRKDCSDKAMEVAWMKSVVAFLNTDGGILIVGVEDNGNVLGTDADRFANDDKLLLHINNLIKQNIGLEFANAIRFNLLPIDGKSVVVFECGVSPAPVFLKNGGAEDFYVRVGPGSRKLTTSEVIAYLSNRDKPN